MCGIFGFSGKKNLSNSDISSLQSVLQHRGPDSSGFLQKENVLLIHTRLSIIDLSEAGTQPMPNEDETLWLVFNGEIYNAPELREWLLTRGHRFRSKTDSEVLLHLYEEQGKEIVNRLRGMFAFVIYDHVKNELFAARDPFGIKPLFYSELSQDFAFASELKALLVLPGFPRQIDWNAFSLYLRLNYIPAPWTIWAQAKRLEPGHCLLVKNGHIVEKRKYVKVEKKLCNVASGLCWPFMNSFLIMSSI